MKMPPSYQCIGGSMRTIRPSSTLPRELNVFHITPQRTFTSSHKPNTPRLAAISNTPCMLRSGNTGQQCQKELESSLRKPFRPFSNTAPRSKLKTIEQVRARNKGGVRLPLYALLSSVHELSGHRADRAFSSHSILPLRSSSSSLPADYGHTLRMRKSAWRGNG